MRGEVGEQMGIIESLGVAGHVPGVRVCVGGLCVLLCFAFPLPFSLPFPSPGFGFSFLSSTPQFSLNSNGPSLRIFSTFFCVC
jgi:hypothetical protein